VTEDLEGRLAAWAAPFAGASPAGADVRYDEAFERLKAEIARLTLPESGTEVDWPGVREGCVDILARRSKDLTVAAYLCVALLATHGLGGLAVGLGVLNRLVGEAWDVVFPPASRLRQRAAVFEWLLDRLLLVLPKPVRASAAEVQVVTAELVRLEGMLRAHLPDVSFNFAGLGVALAPRRFARPTVALHGSFLALAPDAASERVAVRPVAGGDGGAERQADAAAEAWLLGGDARPSQAGGVAVARTAFVLPLGAAGTALGAVWARAAGAGAGCPDFWTTGLPAATPLQALDLLDRLLDRLPPGEVEVPDDAAVAHDLAWGLKDLSIEMFARSVYLDRRAALWPRLVAFLAAHPADLAVRLPSSDLLTRLVWQQVLSRRHHPAVLAAKIWVALWRRLGGAGPLAVLARLDEPWEVTLLARSLGPDDLHLLQPGCGGTVEDLRAAVPAGALPEPHPALDPAGSLGGLLAG
jgi:predicted component of type VI protein secretion system